MAWLLTAFRAHKIWIGIISAAALVAAITIYIHSAEKAKGQNAVLEERISRIERTARINQREVEACQSINAENAAEAARQAQRATEAEIAVSALRAAADVRIERLPAESETLRARGLDCQALDDEFRRWVRR